MKSHLRKRVRFFLQPTKTFTDGAPQREEFDSDESFATACALYGVEWLVEYECVGCEGAALRDCPQHSLERK